ncbi:HlyD family type I secretion periplasmic adaptor subunit [Marichromatium bheemlicum]|uniref:Membrane fusion protein (MFP) family protein n=1 Tax=Marichromatium bheemlicum TaxID=365339 RepID=A0ABX1I5N2_9GAMM|nr:HlyD family type I secretion periplasmic adaptor subunit [Marichromatium bheemlicum]
MSQASDSTTPAPQASIQDQRVRWFGIAVILVMFGGFGSWSAMAMLDSAAVAPGVVTVESYRQAVQHLEGGIVSELLVREGDLVEAGDLLVRLDDTQFSSQLEAVRSELGALLALEARLQAERDRNDEIAFPEELIEQAEHDPRLQGFMETQHQVFVARRADLDGRVGVMEQRIEQLREQVKGFIEQEEKFEKRMVLYEDELEGLRGLYEDGMGDKVRMLALERDQAEVEGDLAAVRSQRASATLQIDETQLQIDQAWREFLRDVVTELSSAQERLFDAQQRHRALADRVRRTQVRAPVSGKVVGLQVHTVGAVISPGERVMDIVPDNDLLVIDAQVSPQDIDKVFPGLEAQVRFTAFNFRTTPTLTGQVVTISGDRLIDEQNGHPYFLARIEIPEDQSQRLGDLKLLPGMPAEAMIVTGERTFLDYLLRPLKDALARSMREE